MRSTQSLVDGSDQPGLRGTTLSIAVKGPDSWEVIRKMRGRTLLTGYWTLSEDGKTLNDAYTEYAPDGSTSLSLALGVRADGGEFMFPGHMGQRQHCRTSASILTM